MSKPLIRSGTTQKKKTVIGIHWHSLAFPKTFSFELRFWQNFVPDMHDSSEK
jgi:hypothetical protein